MNDDPADLAAWLGTLPLFRALPPSARARVAAFSVPRDFGAGETIFLQGEPSRAFWAVREGAVRLHRAGAGGREQVLHRVGPGRTFAEAAVLAMARFPAGARAGSAGARLVEFPRGPILGLLRGEPDIAAGVVASLSMRLLELTDRVELLALVQVPARLARHVTGLPARPAEGGCLAVDLDMAKRELAESLATTPETLSRTLRRWREEGLVRVEGRRLVILDPERLEALAEAEGGNSEGA